MIENENVLLTEYKQTVETLRNWDTLFVNLLISTIVIGGIGSGIAIIKDYSKDSNINHFLFGLITVISFMICLIVGGYVYYALTVAKNKLDVLKRIEGNLNMEGAYRYSGLQKSGFKVLYTGVFYYFVILGNVFLRYPLVFNLNNECKWITISSFVVIATIVFYILDWRDVRKQKDSIIKQQKLKKTA